MSQEKRGVFLTVEGPDGAGKTTSLSFLADYLRERGFTVVTSREPGGTPIGERIREILLFNKMATLTELLLFAASRAEHVETHIKPALANGYVFISDRFSDSTYAYQGEARGFVEDVVHLEEFVQRGFKPDHTLFFDIPFEECIQRLGRRVDKQDRFDQEELEFKKKVWIGYQRRFNANPDRMIRIDALPDPETVKRQLQKWVDDFFAPKYRHLQSFLS